MYGIKLEVTKRTDERLLERMKIHYSKPKGFVGRNICYSIHYDGIYYGHIVAGSSVRFLPGRNEFLDTNLTNINHIINNVFYNVSRVGGVYPLRNFTTKVLKYFTIIARDDWLKKYGDYCLGFETLVELPRTGDLYIKAGWKLVGRTKGYTCKRVGGKGTDSWGGKRVWNTNKEQLRPKLVLCYKVI